MKKNGIENHVKNDVDITMQNRIKRSMLHLCVHNQEEWSKKVGDPELFMDRAAAEGITL